MITHFGTSKDYWQPEIAVKWHVTKLVEKKLAKVSAPHQTVCLIFFFLLLKHGRFFFLFNTLFFFSFYWKKKKKKKKKSLPQISLVNTSTLSIWFLNKKLKKKKSGYMSLSCYL